MVTLHISSSLVKMINIAGDEAGNSFVEPISSLSATLKIECIGKKMCITY